jgi:hypothetical protein
MWAMKGAEYAFQRSMLGPMDKPGRFSSQQAARMSIRGGEISGVISTGNRDGAQEDIRYLASNQFELALRILLVVYKWP